MTPIPASLYICTVVSSMLLNFTMAARPPACTLPLRQHSRSGVASICRHALVKLDCYVEQSRCNIHLASFTAKPLACLPMGPLGGFLNSGIRLLNFHTCEMVVKCWQACCCKMHASWSPSYSFKQRLLGSPRASTIYARSATAAGLPPEIGQELCVATGRALDGGLDAAMRTEAGRLYAGGHISDHLAVHARAAHDAAAAHLPPTVQLSGTYDLDSFAHAQTWSLITDAASWA